jgi:hypothetical protein
LGYSPFEEVYHQNDMIVPTGHARGNWVPKASIAAPMMEHSFSVPGRVAMRW